jgi:hypothetical protein
MLNKLRKRISDERDLWRDMGPFAPVMGCLFFISFLLRPLFFVVDLPFRIRRLLRRRAYSTGHKIEQPPFPPLTWTEYDWWDGRIKLTGWSDFRLVDGSSGNATNTYSLTVTPTDQTKLGALPSRAQTTAINHLITESESIAQIVCQAVMPYFNDAYNADECFFDELQPISSPNEVRGMLELYSVHIHRHQRSECAFVGLQFGCAWDEEHGLGVLFNRSTVVELGTADVAFVERHTGDQSPESTPEL